MGKRIKVGPQHRVTAEQIPERMLAGLNPEVRRLIADGQVEAYVIPEEETMGEGSKRATKVKPPLRMVKSVCDCGRPIDGDHDMCGHCNVLRQAKQRGQDLFMCMADCGAETPFHFCWHCNRLLVEEKAKAKQAWRVAHPDDPRFPQSRRPNSAPPPPTSAPAPELTNEPCGHEGCEHFRLADSPFCYEHTLEQEEIMHEMYGTPVTVQRPRKICAHKGCNVEIDQRHTHCRPHHQLLQQAERTSRPAKPCNKCGTPLPLTFVPDTCKTCYEAGRSRPLDPRRYPVRPEVPASQLQQERLRRSLLEEYRTDRLRSGAKVVEGKGQFAIVYDGKSYTYPDKGHSAARGAVIRERMDRLNRCLLAALKKSTLNKAWTVKEQTSGRWRLSYKGRDWLVTDHEALEAAKRAEAEKARAEAERQATELEARRQRHAELLTAYRAGELQDDVVAEECGVRVAFLLEDGTVLEFEDPTLVAQAEAKRRETDRIKREAAAKAEAEARAAKQAARDAKAQGRGGKKSKK